MSKEYAAVGKYNEWGSAVMKRSYCSHPEVNYNSTSPNDLMIANLQDRSFISCFVTINPVFLLNDLHIQTSINIPMKGLGKLWGNEIFSYPVWTMEDLQDLVNL